MNGDAVLSATDVVFRYAGEASRTPALGGVDLAVFAGRSHHILGANGSGRTTLLTVLAGLAPAWTGGTLGGAVHGSAGTAFVHADPYLNLSGTRDTVRAELAFGLECRSMPRSDMIDRVDGALEAFDLAHLARRDPTTLSGGEAARLAVACQWLCDPTVLLVDEVDAQLDAAGAAAVRRLLDARAAAGGAVVRTGARLDDLAFAAPGASAESSTPGAATMSAASETSAADAPVRSTTAGAVDATVLERGRVVAGGSADDVAARVAEHDWGVVPRGGLHRTLIAATGAPDDGIPTASLAPDATAELEVEGLACTFEGSRVPVLSGIGCRVAPGEVLVVVGPNGGGKSTLARAITGLQAPTAGSVRVGGRDAGPRSPARRPTGADGRRGRRWAGGGPGGWTNAHPSRSGAPVGPARGVALCVQRPERMLFCPTVVEEVAIGLRWCRAAPAAAAAAVTAALAACGLADRAADHPHDLLPSERRWLALAAAVALRTPVVVLDEPTAGFDARDLIRFARLLALLRAAGRSVVWVTHDLALARALGDRAVRLVAGRVDAAGTVDDVIGGAAGGV